MGLIVVSRVKEAAKLDNKPLNVSADFYTRLEEKTKETIIEACKRARANKRNTVMGKDV